MLESSLFGATDPEPLQVRFGNEEKTDVRVGYIDGRWRSDGSYRLGEGPVSAALTEPNWDGWWHATCASYGPKPGDTDVQEIPEQTPSVQSKRVNGKRVLALGAPAGVHEIAIDYVTPPDLVDKDVFLKAYVGEGKAERPLLCERYQLDSNGTGRFASKNGRRQFVFAEGVGPITRVEVMARDIEWVTFKAIRTRPDLEP